MVNNCRNCIYLYILIFKGTFIKYMCLSQRLLVLQRILFFVLIKSRCKQRLHVLQIILFLSYYYQVSVLQIILSFFLIKSLWKQTLNVLPRVLSFFCIIFVLILDTICVNINSYSFIDTDVPLVALLHIGVKLCILNGNIEILIRSNPLTSIKISTSFL